MGNLTSRGPRANRAARLPALPGSTATDPARREWEENVREYLEVRLGARGDRFERAVTFRDLDPKIDDILRRLRALENAGGDTTIVDDCCAELRAAIAAIWAAIYTLRADVDALDGLMQGRLGDLQDRVITNPGVDQYWENVILLVQGGEIGSSTIQDLSTYASTATINAYAEWSDEVQVGGANTIKCTTITPGLSAFTSSGVDSRFGRASGEKWTIEGWLYIDTVENYGNNGWLFSWWNGSGRVMQLGSGNTSFTPRIALRNGDDGTYYSTEVLSGLHFVQMNIDNGAYTVDLDGEEVLSGTNTYNFGSGGTWSFYAGTQTSAGTGTGPANVVYTTPIRVTKGVLRPRGSIPTGLFPTEGPTVLGPSGNANWLTNSPDATASSTVLSLALYDGAGQAGIGHASAPDGSNTVAARSGKVYVEFHLQASSSDGLSFVGLAANSLFSGGYATVDDPETAGFYVAHNSAAFPGNPAAPGIITNGTHAASAGYDFAPDQTVGLAVDFATGKVWISIDGTYVSGDPAAGTGQTFTLPDANFTFVAGGFPASGSASVAYTLQARNGATETSPPTGFTWYA